MIDNSLTSAAVPDTKNQIATFLEDLKSGKVSPLPIGSKTVGQYTFYPMIEKAKK